MKCEKWLPNRRIERDTAFVQIRLLRCIYEGLSHTPTLMHSEELSIFPHLFRSLVGRAHRARHSEKRHSCRFRGTAIVKRVGHIFEAVMEPANLELAFWKASRGKRTRADQRVYAANLDAELVKLRMGLIDGTYPIGNYRRFTVYEPKESPYINRTSHGMDFLGMRIYPGRIRANRASLDRFERKCRRYDRLLAEGAWSEAIYQDRMTALTAFLQQADTLGWRRSRGDCPTGFAQLSTNHYFGVATKSLGFQPCATRRQLEQQRPELPFREPQQQQPVEQQQRLPPLLFRSTAGFGESCSPRRRPA